MPSSLYLGHGTKLTLYDHGHIHAWPSCQVDKENRDWIVRGDIDPLYQFRQSQSISAGDNAIDRRGEWWSSRTAGSGQINKERKHSGLRWPHSGSHVSHGPAWHHQVAPLARSKLNGPQNWCLKTNDAVGKQTTPLLELTQRVMELGKWESWVTRYFCK